MKIHFVKEHKMLSNRRPYFKLSCAVNKNRFKLEFKKNNVLEYLFIRLKRRKLFSKTFSMLCLTYKEESLCICLLALHLEDGEIL